MLSIKDFQKSVYDFFLSRGFLVSPSFLQYVSEDFDADEFYAKLKRCNPVPLFLTDEIFFTINAEKEKIEGKKQEVEIISSDTPTESRVIVVKSYVEKIKKKDVMDFVNYYRARYNSIKNILLNRQELQNAVSINRILQRTEKDFVSLIGIVKDKKISKNGNIILVLEDLTGTISVIVNKNKQEFFSSCQDILLDEVIGVSGVNSDKIVFANDIILPDVPINNELKKSNTEEYVVFTSDLHVGSKMFFENNFLNFISWINGDYGSEEHKSIAKKVKYLFIGGDLVEGIGIYPGQEEDLVIKDIYEQYTKLAEYISKIRADLPIVVIGGNHDALRLSEPQPPINPKIAPSLYGLKNIIFVTNPSVINIGSTDRFSGFNVLLYHGGSFPYLSENVDSIRRNGRLNRPDLIMKYLLQRRHLSVSHTSTLYIPGDEDHLVIDKVPDFFISGHIHKTILNSYRNVTIAACGCWTGQTDDQARRGIVPDPNRIILVNLQTREPKILNFEE